MSYPYLQARNHGGDQSSVNRIVIHATVSPTVVGGAQSIANYFHTTTRDASAHYVVDPKYIWQCLHETTVGYHAPPNYASIGIELCDPQEGSGTRWSDSGHRAMLKLAADLTKKVASRWNVPLRKLSASDLRAGKRGVCGHVDVSNAWHLTDHGDPGSAFPWNYFMALLHDNPPKEDDVPQYMSLGTSKEFQVYAGRPVRVKFDHEYADSADARATGTWAGIIGAGNFVAQASVWGVAGKWRLIEVDPDNSYKTSKTYPYKSGDDVVTGRVDAKQHLYLEFTPSETGQAKAAVKVNYWPA